MAGRTLNDRRPRRDHAAKLLPLFVTLCAVMLRAPTPARAHIPTDLVGTQVKILFFEDRVRLVVDVGYRGTWAQAEMIGMDANEDSAVDQAEADAYAAKLWRTKILRTEGKDTPAVTVKIDGQPVPIVLRETKHEELVGRVFPSPFTIYYTCDVAIPGGPLDPETPHEIEVVDVVTKGEVDDKPDFLVPFSGHGNAPEAFRFSPEFIAPPSDKIALDGFGDQWVAQDTETLRLRFEFARVLRASASDPTTNDSTTSGTLRKAAETKDPAKETEAARQSDQVDAGRLAQALVELSGAGAWETLLVLLLAMSWGAGHAFTPGHGSMMVASYLVGTQGRVREVFLLGIATTITHTLVAFGLGLVILLVANHYATTSEGALANRVQLLCMVLSGALLALLGLAMFFRRSYARSGGQARPPTRACAESEEPLPPPMQASEESARPSFREVVALGFSGGLLPCPAASTIVLLGLHYPQHLVFAILLVIAFGLGLGAVLILTGSIFATGRMLAPGRRLEEGVFFQEATFLRSRFPLDTLVRVDRTAFRLVRTLPAISSLFVAGLGTFFVARSITSYPTEARAILDSLGL